MASEIFKYRIWCETEQVFVTTWDEDEPTVCPNNNTHTIDGDQTAVIDEVTESHVEIDNMATLDSPLKSVQRVVMQPARTGYYMCDRDVKISTGYCTEADALEDLKVNPANNKQIPWGEVSLVGCYKLSGEDYVLVDDQADADANAVLTIIDMVCIDQTTQAAIEYDFKGGCLWCDSNLQGDKWGHRLYCMMAPNIPSSMGGNVKFFDGYLATYEGQWQECINTLALTINPSQTVEAARIRFWLYYPAGAKQNHVLRIITYRQPATF